jgi:hypothetical protein
MTRKRKPTAVFGEWMRLIDSRLPDGEYPAETREVWANLWAEHICGTRLSNTDVEDAALLCGLGWDLAVQQGDYALAKQRLERWFEHPLADSADEITRIQFLCQCSLASLLTGEVDLGVASYRLVLQGVNQKHHRVALYTVRSQLYDFCRWQDAATPICPALAVLVGEVLKRFGGQGLALKDVDWKSSTYGQLTLLLGQTYPKPQPGGLTVAAPDRVDDRCH